MTRRTPSRLAARLAPLVLLALALLLAAPTADAAALDGTLEIELDQTEYKVGDKFELTISGNPGDYVFLVFAFEEGTTVIPDLGTFDVVIDENIFLIPLKRIPTEGSKSVSCIIDCLSPLLDTPFYLQVFSFNPFDFTFCVSNAVEVFYDSSLSPDTNSNSVPDECEGLCDELICLDIAAPDEYSTSTNTHAFWFGSCLGKDWKPSDKIEFVERLDGTAQIRGRIERMSNPDECFFVDIELDGKSVPGDAGYPPAGSPKTSQLTPEALAENGGPVDPDTWRYYEELTGVLIGCGDFEGAIYRLERRGPAFQAGIGANLKNAADGASTWFEAIREEDSNLGGMPESCDGDINVNLIDCPPEDGETLCIDEALRTDGSYDIGLTPQGLGGFDFETGTLYEDPDGFAVLSGLLRSESDGNNLFRVTGIFEGRLAPGDAAHPPSDPGLELDASEYVDNGGTIDPDTWRYYESARIVLVGEGGYAGAVLKGIDGSQDLQIGVGANGANTEFGGSARISVWTLSQPSAGDPLPWDMKAELRFVDVECPPICVPDAPL